MDRNQYPEEIYHKDLWFFSHASNAMHSGRCFQRRMLLCCWAIFFSFSFYSAKPVWYFSRLCELKCKSGASGKTFIPEMLLLSTKSFHFSKSKYKWKLWNERYSLFLWKPRFSCHTKCHLTLERERPPALAFWEKINMAPFTCWWSAPRGFEPWAWSPVRRFSNRGVTVYHHHNWVYCDCNIEALSFDNSQRLWSRYAPIASILWALKGSWNCPRPWYIPANNDTK